MATRKPRPKRRCRGTTKKGKRCRAAPLRDGDCCLAHSDEETRTSANFQQGPRPGRPRLPRPHERMRERIEEQIDTVLDPYFKAITDAVLHSSFEGEVMVSPHPDLGARIAAAERLLDRVYGKPRQRVEHTGDPEHPVEVDGEIRLDSATREAISGLLTRRTPPREE